MRMSSNAQAPHRRCRLRGRDSRAPGGPENGQCRPPAGTGRLASCSCRSLGPSVSKLQPAGGWCGPGWPCAVELELPAAGTPCFVPADGRPSALLPFSATPVPRVSKTRPAQHQQRQQQHIPRWIQEVHGLAWAVSRLTLVRVQLQRLSLANSKCWRGWAPAGPKRNSALPCSTVPDGALLPYIGRAYRSGREQAESCKSTSLNAECHSRQARRAFAVCALGHASADPEIWPHRCLSKSC